VVFTAAKAHKKVDELFIADIDADLLRAFLRHIEEKRKCSISSRNQRLAAIHALAGFIAERCPEYLESLLSGYKLNKFSWLSAPGNSSWESIC
jgi:hypothetical protein